MKKLLFLFLLATGFCQAQAIVFTDPMFKTALLNVGAYTTVSGGSPVNIDTNDNGEIEQSEALLIKRIYFNLFDAFSNTGGIQYFTNLIELGFDNQDINNPNLSALIHLQRLSFMNNTQLAALNVSALTELRELSIRHCHSLTSLNVSNLPLLENLTCHDSELTSLTINNLPNLTEMDIYGNELSAVDFSGVPNLEVLTCSNNYFTTINLSMLTNLKQLNIGNTPLNTLNVTSLTDLNTLICGGTNLTNLNIDTLTNLETLNVAWSPMSTLNLAVVPNLKHLDCMGTQIPSLDVSGLTHLESLFCGSQTLQTLTLSPSISNLQINGCPISAYAFNDVPLLEQLSISNSGMLSVDISACPQLDDLSFQFNDNLEYINIKNGRQMTWLDINHCPNLLMVCADNSNMGMLESLTDPGYANNPYVQANSYCSFTPGGVYNTISGQLHFDDENDGCDANEAVFHNALLSLWDGSSTFTTSVNESGYRFYRQLGNFTLTPHLENPQYFNVSPASATVNFSTVDGQNATRNFCVTANGIHPEAEIVLYNNNNARPGFDAEYAIVYRNTGNQTLEGNITLHFDDATADFVSADPMPGTVTSGTLYWTFTDLAPFETRSIPFTINLNGPMETPPLNQDDILHFSADLYYMVPDLATLHADTELNQIVVNSLDPNDKTCLEGNTISSDMIGDYVHYNINFENIGTAEAINVVIKDVIDTSKFDLSTLQVIHASHPMVTRVEGNTVEFIFQNINLPGTAGDNKGNVVFKIKTWPTLVLGNSISNKAEIFFDYNFPIETNVATSTFSLLKAADFKIEATIRVTPNPSNGTFIVKTDSNIEYLQLFDLQGRILLSSNENSNETSIDISSRPNGVYFLKVGTEKGSKVEKLIKQ